MERGTGLYEQLNGEDTLYYNEMTVEKLREFLQGLQSTSSEYTVTDDYISTAYVQDWITYEEWKAQRDPSMPFQPINRLSTIRHNETIRTKELESTDHGGGVSSYPF